MLSVLLVEDNNANASYLRELAKRNKHSSIQIERVKTLAECIASLKKNKPDVVLLDITLPDSEGLGGLRQIRATDGDIPVVILTGHMNEAMAIEALRSGAQDYLFKDHITIEHYLSRSIEYAIERNRVLKGIQDVSRHQITLNAELMKREQVLDQFFTLSIDMLCIAGTDGHFKRLNPAFESLGYSTEELLGKLFMDFIHPDDVSSTVAEFEKLANGVKTLNFEKQFRCKDGTYRLLLWTIAPDSAENLYAVARDVTESRKAETALIKASEQALVASITKSEFLANVSHEIRTPMNSVLGLAGVLLNCELTPEARKYVEMIKRSGQSLLTIINDILDFSKIEAGKLEIETVDFEFSRMVIETCEILGHWATEKGLKLTTEISADVPQRLKGDPGRIRQILNNLIGNAIKFTEHGEVEVRILKNKTNENKIILKIEVRDTGIGIPKATSKKLFTEFSQGDASTTRKYGGTGLGLSISRRLVEMMGGTIGVESIEGKGSTFWFTVELEKSINTAPGIQKPIEKVTLQDTKKRRILIAEDNQTNQLVMVKMIENLGYSADVAGNGKEAIEMLSQFPYDLVLMDCRMPEMDGYTATRNIRDNQKEVFRNIPIIALTANAIEGDNERCLSAGMNDYLTKPIEAVELNRKLEYWTRSEIASNEKHHQKHISISSYDKVIDYMAIQKLLDIESQDNQSEFLNQLLETFFKNTPLRISKMRMAASAGDFMTIANEAHNLKSSCAYVGAKVVQTICARLESLDEHQHKAEATTLIDNVEKEYISAQKALLEIQSSLNQSRKKYD